jgi:GntR family transcriptional regulator/MocR family aminotransferase
MPPDPDSPLPIYEQLYREIRDQAVSGRLRGGVRLASTRVLAAELGVSRFTIVTAIERLLAEGYLVARRGAGTFVVDTLPEQALRAPAGAGAGRPRASTRSRTPVLSLRGAALSAVPITGPRGSRNEPRPFRPRRPALDVFPTALWTRLLQRQWRSGRHELLDYGDPAGYLPLRRAIAEQINIARGMRCDPAQVIVTSGAQQAFEMLFRLVLDPGDAAWMEDPGYLDVRAALVSAGAKLIPVPVDRDGVDVAAGTRLAPHAKLAVVSPSHQYPTGATLSAARRAALLEWARGAGAWIVEDDYDSYFRYRGRPLPALHRFDADRSGQDDAPRVLYVGTFSKTMFPSLRLGFCVVPDSLVDAAANARAVAGRNSPIADQAALAGFIADGHYDRHLRRARLIYQERHEAMRDAFTRKLAGAVTLSPASAGTHVLGWIAGDRHASRNRAVAVSRAAADEDLVVFPLSRYCLVPPARDALVLGYGGLSPRRIAWGAERLARILEPTGRARSSA